MDIFLLYLHSDGFGCPKPNSCFHILRRYTLNHFLLNFRNVKNLVFFLFTKKIHPYQTPAASCVSLNLQKIFKDLIQDLEYKCILFLDEIEEEEFICFLMISIEISEKFYFNAAENQKLLFDSRAFG